MKQDRGTYAHKKLKQFIFCTHGEVEFILDGGINRESVILNAPNQGIYISKPLWHEITNFKNDLQAIIWASDIYRKRSYEEFKQWKSNS